MAAQYPDCRISVLPAVAAYLCEKNNGWTYRKNAFLVIIALLSTVSFASPCNAEPFMFGVTIDDPWQPKIQIQEALAAHAMKPTTRIVFDKGQSAAKYAADNAVQNITAVSFVMAEPIDADTVASYTVTEYLDRMEEYLDQFGGQVNIWEIGNEVNGDWLGTVADVKAKIEGTYALVKARNYTTALNFYYNKFCPGNPENEMFTWINDNVSGEMKAGLDYVFFSYYEDDCNGVIVSEAEWQQVFDRLHTLFPNSKLGFGEVGTELEENKADYIHRYYELDIRGDYFVGGYFWWYYKQDCVPRTKDLWDTLNTIIARKKATARARLLPMMNLLLLCGE